MADVNAKEHEMGQKMWHRISTITVLPALAGLMLTALSLFMLTVLARNEAEAQQSQRGDSRRMNINIIVGDTAVRAVLDDNPTSRDFVAMLPMTVQFEDFAKTEKITRLSKRLSTDGRTTDYEANVWDVT